MKLRRRIGPALTAMIMAGISHAAAADAPRPPIQLAQQADKEAGDPKEQWEDTGREKRARPMLDQDLLDFLENVVRGQELDKKCDLLDGDQKAMLFLSYKWGSSVAMNGTYPDWLFLHVIQLKAEFDRQYKTVKCAHPSMRRFRRAYRRFLRLASETIRMEEIEIGGFNQR